jgi:2-hydroxy-3-oxopropionate reductase
MTAGVGFIGLGVMGRPMARNLLRAGFEVYVASRSPGPVAELAALGATAFATPAEVGRATSVILTSLPDDAAVRSVIVDGLVETAALEPGSTVVDTSTVSAEAAREVGAAVEAAGGSFLDAPVSGGEAGAIAGSLSIMVGGPADVLDQVRPVLEAVGERIVHVGPVGAGQAAKMCNQLVVMSTLEAVAEALVLARVLGVDPGRVRDALLGGLASSRVLELAGARMLEGNFEPGGRARTHLKDIAGIRAALARSGATLPGFEQAAAQIERLIATGQGDLDHSAIVAMVEASAGAQLREEG